MTPEELAAEDRPVRRLDEVLHVLVDPMVARLRGEDRARLEAAEDALRRCIEVHAEIALDASDLVLLALEAQLDDVGAAARIASATGLLRVLPRFLAEPAWEGEDDDDRRTRMRLALDLARATVFLPECADAVDERARVMAAHRAAGWRLRRDQHQRRLEVVEPAQRAWIEMELAELEKLAKARLQPPEST